MSKARCRLCNSEYETQSLQVNGRKLHLCVDCLLLISEVVKDSVPTILEDFFTGIKKSTPKWKLSYLEWYSNKYYPLTYRTIRFH